jgi:hypothetical protein
VPGRSYPGGARFCNICWQRPAAATTIGPPLTRASVWIGDLGGWWDETDFHETHDTAFLLARLDQLWRRVPRYKPLSVGVVLLDLVPAVRHQPDLFAADNHRRQKLSPLVDRINDRYGRCAIGFGLFPPDVRAFKGHAAFHRVPERWEF